MKNFYRLMGGVDVGPLAAKLARNPEWWGLDTYLRSFPQGPFGDTESIICRFPPRPVPKTEEEKQEYLRTTDEHECVNQPIYGELPEARQIVMALMTYVGGTRLGRVMINKLKPGGRVYKHADTVSHADYWSRHHVVIQSAPGVVFSAGDESVYMGTGEIWYFNNGKSTTDGSDRPEHEVLNNSSVDRIHMVVDVKA